MSTIETADQGHRHRRRAVWLVMTHLVAGLVLGGFTRWWKPLPGYPVFVLAGFVCAQASLVGMWAALGSSPSVVRLTGLAVCVSYLGLMFGFCIDQLETEIVIMVASTAFLVAALLLAARYSGVGLADDRDPAGSPAPSQFSIQQLLLFTGVVACLLAVGRWIWPSLDVNDLLAVSIIAALFATIAIAAVWALLGTKYPWLWLSVPSGLAFAAAWGLGRQWASATLTETLTLAVTLGVLRFGNFRLRRRGR